MRTAALLVALAAIAVLGYQSLVSSSSTTKPPPDVPRKRNGAGTAGALPGRVWPPDGQAAAQIGRDRIHAGPDQHPAPIASVAKVMTAYVVLRDHPLQPGEHGPTLTLIAAEVADTERRRGRGESVAPVAAGEQLTELQALQALLLPSANNLAAVLARWAAGSEARFVARLNATTRSLGMTDTRYTDPRVTTRRRCRLPPEETPCIEHCKRSSLLR